MILDLYIESNTPVLHRGTGVYTRKNGETVELATKQEVLTYFPDTNPDEIEEKIYEDNEYFHMNITHNLGKMARECRIIGTCNYDADSATVTLYDLLWHPEELKVSTPTLDYLSDLMECYKSLMQSPDFFKQWNPDNGWESYEGLVRNTKNYIKALISISDEFENYKIVTST